MSGSTRKAKVTRWMTPHRLQFMRSCIARHAADPALHDGAAAMATKFLLECFDEILRLQGTSEAAVIATVLAHGHRAGFGNLISALQAEWAETLMREHDFPEKTALRATVLRPPGLESDINEADRNREIVARLPKSRDGQPMLIGDHIFFVPTWRMTGVKRPPRTLLDDYPEEYCITGWTSGVGGAGRMIHVVDEDGKDDGIMQECCFASLEAAKAAMSDFMGKRP